MSIDKDDNHIFTLSGMDDETRNNFKETHPEGTIITYECSGFTNKGLPRFGRYLRKRDDIIIKEHDETEISIHKLERVKEIFKFMEEHYKKNYDIMRKNTYSKINKSLNELKSDNDLSQEKLSSIKGIGKGTIDRIMEIKDTDTLKEYEKLKNNKSPLEDFLKIHGVGKQHAKKLLSEGFNTIDDLRKCNNIEDYLNDTQLKGLKYYDDIQQRIPYNEIRSLEIHFHKILKKIDKDSELTIAGSYRRKSSDSGDIDILLKSDDKKTYNKFIDVLKDNNLLVEDLARGNKKYMGLGKTKMSKWCRRIDIMYTKPEEYPFAVLYFTGSGEFNERMRGDALKQGFTMNEYGIKGIDGSRVDYDFNHEGDIFKFLKYKYIQPENRK
jgi:DNA polymerase/3'-5' exonuclease PolX